jgi:hypothetical protein
MLALVDGLAIFGSNGFPFWPDVLWIICSLDAVSDPPMDFPGLMPGTSFPGSLSSAC